jgi:hypothetical protein
MKSEARMVTTHCSGILNQRHHHILTKDNLSIALPGAKACIAETLRTHPQTERIASSPSQSQVREFAIENIPASTFERLSFMMVRGAVECLPPLARR